MKHDGETTRLRRCHVCSEIYEAALALPIEGGRIPTGCCPPCGWQEYPKEPRKFEEGDPGDEQAE